MKVLPGILVCVVVVVVVVVVVSLLGGSVVEDSRQAKENKYPKQP